MAIAVLGISFTTLAQVGDINAHVDYASHKKNPGGEKNDWSEWMETSFNLVIPYESDVNSSDGFVVYVYTKEPQKFKLMSHTYKYDAKGDRYMYFYKAKDIYNDEIVDLTFIIFASGPRHIYIDFPDGKRIIYEFDWYED